MPSSLWKHVEKRVQSLDILVIDDNTYMRKVVRTLLMNVGVRNIYEAADGIAGLEAIRNTAPDIAILDWEMPFINGPEMVRIIRSPGVFPMPDIPIIMLSSHAERWRVVEAVRLGINEFLVKPVSAKSLMDRLVSILAKPRPIVQQSDYYGPEPRKFYPDPAADPGSFAAPPTNALRH